MYFLKVNPGAPVTLSLTSSEDKSLCGISVVDKVREGFKNIKKNIKAIFHLGFLKIFCLLKCSFRLFSVIKNNFFTLLMEIQLTSFLKSSPGQPEFIKFTYFLSSSQWSCWETKTKYPETQSASSRLRSETERRADMKTIGNTNGNVHNPMRLSRFSRILG